jgi:hypothetical protein
MITIVNKIISILCYLPYLYLSLFYTYVLRAVIKLGRLPSYDNPDPKELGFDHHREIIYKTFDYSVYSIGIGVMLLILLRLAGKLDVNKIHLIMFSVGVIAVMLHLFADPFDEWFVD